MLVKELRHIDFFCMKSFHEEVAFGKVIITCFFLFHHWCTEDFN